MAFKIKNFSASPLRNEEEPKKQSNKVDKYAIPGMEKGYFEAPPEPTPVPFRPEALTEEEKVLENKSRQALTANKKIGETALGTQYPQTANLSEAIYKATGRVVPQLSDNTPPLSPVEGKKGLSGMKEAGKEFIQDLKTLTGNPFDGVRAVLRTDDSGGDFPTSVKNLRALKNLAERDDGSVNSEQAKSILSPSQAFNAASAFLPPVLAADTAAALISGDPVAAILKKGKYFKPLGKILKKSNLGKSIYDSLDEVYYGYKGAKKLL